MTKRPGTARESIYTNVNLGKVPAGGSLSTPRILGTGATFHLGLLRLHMENLECRAQKCAVPCRFFSVCKWGLRLQTCIKFQIINPPVPLLVIVQMSWDDNSPCVSVDIVKLQ